MVVSRSLRLIIFGCVLSQDKDLALYHCKVYGYFSNAFIIENDDVVILIGLYRSWHFCRYHEDNLAATLIS